MKWPNSNASTRFKQTPPLPPDSYEFPIQMRSWIYQGPVVVNSVEGNTVPGLGSVDGEGGWKPICEYTITVTEVEDDGTADDALTP